MIDTPTIHLQFSTPTMINMKLKDTFYGGNTMKFHTYGKRWEDHPTLVAYDTNFKFGVNQQFNSDILTISLKVRKTL